MKRDPMNTSAFGEGIQIGHAIKEGAKAIYVGLGGSATNDGGIGFFSNKPNSQMYPIKEMNTMYGDKGNFIAVVQSGKSGAFGKQFERLIKTFNLIETNSFIASSALPGVDFSGHLNYWKF